MIIRSLVFAAVLLTFTSPSFAFHCPAAMAQIDAALAAGTDLDEATLKEVKELRTEGEKLHKAGKHYASVATLWVAQQLLGIEDEKSEEGLHIGNY